MNFNYNAIRLKTLKYCLSIFTMETTKKMKHFVYQIVFEKKKILEKKLIQSYT